MPLVRGDGSCTLLWCNYGCCNQCGAFLQLGRSTPGESDRHHRAATIQLPDPVGCGGDETLICSVHAHDQKVVTRGHLHLQGMTWLLEPLALCTTRRSRDLIAFVRTLRHFAAASANTLPALYKQCLVKLAVADSAAQRADHRAASSSGPNVVWAAALAEDNRPERIKNNIHRC